MSFMRHGTRGLLLCLSLALAACGGGGGSSPSGGTNTAPPPGGNTEPPPVTPPSDGGGNTQPPTTNPPADGDGNTQPPPTNPPPTDPPPIDPPGDEDGDDGSDPVTPPVTLSLSPTTLTFNADSPNANIPDDQFVTATYNGTVTGTLRIVALGDGSGPDTVGAVDSMTVFEFNNGARRARVRPSSPDLLGPGTHTRTVTVVACINGDAICSTNQVPGSPQTFTVTYVVGPVPAPPDAVMPRIATAGASDHVIVRGASLGGTTSVHFGPHAATDVTVVSDTEVRAAYPALASGTYAVQLNSGAIPFTGSIVAVPPVNHSSERLDLPEMPMGLSLLRYDAERGALLAGGQHTQQGVVNKLWRYTHDGISWSSAETFPVDGLVTASVAPDGSRIIALVRDGLVELDADDLSVLQTTPAPAAVDGTGSMRFMSIAFANNGMALIGASGQSPTGPDPIYYFSLAERTLRLTRSGLFNTPFARWFTGAQDGSRVLGSVSGIYPAPRMLNYDPVTTQRTFTLNVDSRKPVMAERHGQKIVGTPSAGLPQYGRVYAADGQTLLGTLPGPPDPADFGMRIRLIELNPQGTRAYVLRDNNNLHTYALDQPTAVDGSFAEVGSPTTIVPPTQNNNALLATMTPDGRTLFIGGNRGVLVIPALN